MQHVETPKPELVMPRADLEAQLLARIAIGNTLRETHIETKEDFETVQRGYWTWDEFNMELLTQAASTDDLMRKYHIYAYGAGSSRSMSLGDQVKWLREDLSGGIRRLESILGQLPIIPERASALVKTRVGAQPVTVLSRTVFVVHGHDEAAKQSVARLIEKLGLSPVILHEQPNNGRTIIEKFEQHAEQSSYAVVLLTPDDIGGANKDSLLARARQNVVLELGFFLGSLGRKRVCALYSGEVDLPSDLAGVLYIPLDQPGAWRFTVAKELRAAGYSVDLNKLVD
jgi:predicted nucleotide-binding protein